MDTKQQNASPDYKQLHYNIIAYVSHIPSNQKQSTNRLQPIKNNRLTSAEQSKTID